MNAPATPTNNGRVNRVATPPTAIGPRPPLTGPPVSESDRNNNATPPSSRGSGSLPPPPVMPNARRPIQPRSPPVGARPKDLPPGAAPLGSIPRPPVPSSSSQAMSVPLLACQLGRPVNLGERGPPGPLGGGPHLGGMPPLSPHHISNLLSHTLFAAIPTGNGRIMARNINGNRKFVSFLIWSTVELLVRNAIVYTTRLTHLAGAKKGFLIFSSFSLALTHILSMHLAINLLRHEYEC